MLATAAVLDGIGRGLREALLMFWATLWALVLGFTLSGAVQAFVGRSSMERSLGDHRPTTVVRASGLGMVSSSCSYAAAAMTKSLFQKGADLLAALAFMVASTNLVVELGLVLAVLLGWQFLAAEFVGGPIMIVLLVLLGAVVLTGPLVTAARRRLDSGRAAETAGVAAERQAELEAEPWRAKLGSPAAWADAAAYSVADLTMLRRELVVGYTVAGFLAALVPASAWSALFVSGHGWWTTLQNALVGPLIAVLSWVCSIGNVPLAAALWHGGISFGGVVAFVFADLIAFPLILIYRKYYGRALTVRLVAVLYAVMVAAGLATQAIFSAAGLVPPHPTSAPVAGSGLGWNVTTVANVVALVVAGVLYALYRNRGRLGGGRGSAVDPVCGMVVRPADAPARVIHGGRPVHFCSDRCAERFAADPARYAGRGSAEPAPAAAEPAPAAPEPVAFVRRSGPGPEPGRRPSIRSTPVADPTRRR